MKPKLVLSLFVLALVCSCASSPYKVSLNTGDTLYGKTAVLLEIGIAKQRLMYFPLLETAIYNSSLESNIEGLEAAQRKGNSELYQRVTGWFRNNYNMAIVRSPYSFADKKLPLNFFRKSSTSEMKQNLAAICEENNADCLITVMSQYITTAVGLLGISGANKLRLEICVFDRDGSLIGYGTADTGRLILRAKEVEGFASLYELISKPARELIIALGTSKRLVK
jgi:hypothetical protein